MARQKSGTAPKARIPAPPVDGGAQPQSDIAALMQRIDHLTDVVKEVVGNYNEVAKRIGQHEEALKSIAGYLEKQIAGPADHSGSSQPTPAGQQGPPAQGTDINGLMRFAEFAKQTLMPSPPDPMAQFTHQIMPNLLGQLLQDQIDIGKIMKQQLLRRAGIEISEQTFKD